MQESKSDEEQPQSGYEVVGISLFGPPPLGDVHLKWAQALHIAYGVNGAGKTVLLATIEMLLRGQPTGGDAFLHVRINRDLVTRNADDETEGLIGNLYDALLEDLDDRGLRPVLGGNRYHDPPASLSDYQLARDSDRLSSVLKLALGIELEHDVDAAETIANEILDEQLLSFSPSGPNHSFVYVSSRLGDFAPATAARVADRSDGGFRRPKRHVLTSNPSFSSPEAESLLFTHRPDWVPVPICLVGETRTITPVSVLTTDGLDVPDSATSDLLRGLLFWPDSEQNAPFEVRDDFLVLVEQLSVIADSIYQSLLLRAPHLRLQLEPPSAWLRGQLLRWEAQDRTTGDWLPFAALSRGQRRWASAAILLASRAIRQIHPTLGRPADELRPEALLIDEPEDALHPQAIDHMTEGLRSLSARRKGMAIVTTHSPQVLGAPGAKLMHVSRSPLGLTEVTPLEESLRNDLDEMADLLELRPTDLMQIYQVVLIVEGAHDSTVLKGLFGDEWAKARTRILHMAGTRNLVSVAGADVLFGFTNAEVVVMLDNATRNQIPSLWTEMRALASDGNERQALARLQQFEKEHRRDLEAEEVTALEFCRKAIHLGTPHRLHLYGLAVPDIINYFDPATFVASELSWEELATEFRHRPPDLPRLTFKAWLGQRPDRRVAPSMKSIERATPGLRENPPAELTELLDMCRLLGGAEQ